ncbi:hypothetical protein F0U47_11400 [Nocardioides antri]|uniref:Uncharacterized protein n=2 Tax=Nocardioides antri TaxID=2607659 RepID=A0A5B1M457_9ACTN|nr:hypothetical protein F0U47_11400 [Nocardioides antri]
MEDRDAPPPPYFGDYPDGPYWSAVPRGEKVDVEDDYTVDGRKLEIMWDEGAGPLWGIEGLLPDEPAWLQQALGLSEALIADLLSWRNDMDAFNHSPHEDWLADQKELDLRAGELAERLQAEVGTRYEVRYHA